jgi:Concanavalin A-like lectin/glucanases superfamily
MAPRLNPSVGAAADLIKSVTFYASFDMAVKGDFGGGELTLSTRSNHKTEKGAFVFEKGFPQKAFRVAPGRGISGGALEAVDVLPDNGRIFFPAKGNIAYKKGGWSGALSVWINHDPDTQLKTGFCDPVQITQKGAGNGGIWFDYNDAKPKRNLRMGTFPAIGDGRPPISESREAFSPMVWVDKPGFKVGDWHHVALVWRNFDTGENDASAALYIDGKLMGEIKKDYPISMDWELDKTGIYVAVSYIGLMDELALFNRALTQEEIGVLRSQPAVLSSLVRK